MRIVPIWELVERHTALANKAKESGHDLPHENVVVKTEADFAHEPLTAPGRNKNG